MEGCASGHTCTCPGVPTRAARIEHEHVFQNSSWKAYQNNVVLNKTAASSLYQQLIAEATKNNIDEAEEANTLNYLEEIFEICHFEFNKEEYMINLNEELKSFIKEAITETLDDIVESKLNKLMESNKEISENLQIRVGDSMFIGKITDVRNVK